MKIGEIPSPSRVPHPAAVAMASAAAWSGAGSYGLLVFTDF